MEKKDDEIENLRQRVEDVEVLLCYLAANIYSPADPVVQRTLGQIRERGTHCLVRSRKELPQGAPSNPKQADQAQDKWNKMFQANTNARQARAKLDQLKQQGDTDDEQVAAVEKEAEEAEAVVKRITLDLGIGFGLEADTKIEQ